MSVNNKRACDCALNIHGVVDDIGAIRRLKKTLPREIFIELQTFIDDAEKSCGVDLTEERELLQTIMQQPTLPPVEEVQGRLAVMGERLLRKVNTCATT